MILLLADATQELFALQGLALSPSNARAVPPAGRQILGTIGFAGPDMKGTLAILAGQTFWASVAPPEQPQDEYVYVDMVGEYSNMLLGRLRNAMLALGAEVATGIPTAVCGTDLAVQRSATAKPEWHVFRSDSGPFYLRVQVAFRRGFELSESSEWSVRPNEADLVLF
jgi:hypothetical protein